MGIAPEVLLQREYDGMATDIWSEGIVLLEIQCGIRVMSKIFDMPNSQIGAINLSNRENRLVVGNMIKSRFTANSAGNMLEEHCWDDLRSLLPVTKPLLAGVCEVNVSKRSG